ncbi:MAG: hypothetical protein SGILL_009293 [Bacillariaceae sp.]
MLSTKQVPRDSDGVRPSKSIGKRKSIVLCVEIEIDEDGKPIDQEIPTDFLDAFFDSPSGRFEDASGAKYSVKKAKIQAVKEILTKKDREIRFQKDLISTYTTENARFAIDAVTRKYEMQSALSSAKVEAAASIAAANEDMALFQREMATALSSIKRDMRLKKAAYMERVLKLEHQLRCTGVKVPRVHPWDNAAWV